MRRRVAKLSRDRFSCYVTLKPAIRGLGQLVFVVAILAALVFPVAAAVLMWSNVWP